MKIFKKTLLLTLVLIGSNVIEANSSVIVVLKFGRSRDCKGIGICQGKIVITTDDAPKPIGNQVSAIADINMEGRLVLTFNRKTDLTQEAFQTYFSKGIFICEDDFPVPSEILRTLNYPGSFTVKAGDYPISMTGDLITIVF